MTNRIELFQQALTTARQSLLEAPYMFPLVSIVEQLEYLIDLETGRTSDSSKLNAVTVGEIAARDIENFDSKLATLLHEVSAQVRQMSSRRR